VYRTTSFTPPFGERCEISNSLDCHQLYIVIVANGCGYTQGPFWLPRRIALVGRIKLKTYEDVRRRTLPLLPTTPPSVVAAKTRIQRCLCRKVDEIWQYRTGENLTIFNKDHDTAEEGRSRRFLQSSIRIRYNYYVQLVAIKRDWKSREMLFRFGTRAR